MKTLNLDITHAQYFVEKEYESLLAKSAEALETLNNGTGAGADFLGWNTLPSSTSDELLGRIEKTAERLQENCDYVVCVGIGGSAIPEMLCAMFFSRSLSDISEITVSASFRGASASVTITAASRSTRARAFLV